MNKLTKGLVIIGLLFFYITTSAQRQTEYNRKGDEAMSRSNYREAKFWYEEGIAYCDVYSVDQLTSIWQLDESMHVSMKSVMGKCLNCLIESAALKDTLAMKKLVVYYREGIGTDVNELSADHWKTQIESVRNSNLPFMGYVREPKEKIRFSVGYNYSPITPFGLQVTGMGKKIGGYLRIRANFNTRPDVIGDCTIKLHDGENRIDIPALNESKYRATGKTQHTVLIGSAGMLYHVFSTVYLSAGIGFWKHDLYREYETLDGDSGKNVISKGWARDKTPSNVNDGIIFDLDANYHFAKRFYTSLGGTLMSFKYIYPSVGVGVIF